MTGEDVALKVAKSFAEKNSKIEELHIVVDACPVATFISGPHGECAYVNRAYQELVGRSYKLCLGDQWKRFIHPDDLGPAADIWGQAVATCSPYQAEYRIVDNHGTEIPVHVRAVPLPGGGFVGYMTGVTCKFECVTRAREMVRTTGFAPA